MAEYKKPVIVCKRNVVVFGREGITAPIASALFPKQAFPEDDVQQLPDTSLRYLCKILKKDEVEYKILLINTYCNSLRKSAVETHKDFENIQKLCADSLPEGLNLIIFVLYPDIRKGEIEAFQNVLKSMNRSVVMEMATLVTVTGNAAVMPRQTTTSTDTMGESDFTEVTVNVSEAKRVLKPFFNFKLPQRLIDIISVDELISLESDIDTAAKTVPNAHINHFSPLLKSSKEMWLTNEIFNSNTALEGPAGKCDKSDKSRLDSKKITPGPDLPRQPLRNPA